MSAAMSSRSPAIWSRTRSGWRRTAAAKRCADAGLTLRVPRPRLCTDNGAMVVGIASALLAAGTDPSPLTVAADPGLPVEVTQVD